MRLIVSAFKGNDAQRNARNTARLIEYLNKDGYACELVLGMNQGKREVSVDVQWPEPFSSALSYCSALCIEFEQDCVYLERGGGGYLVFRDTRIEYIGIQAKFLSVKDMLRCGKGQDGYTEYLDGSVLCTLAAPLAQAA